jgi:uncharacterized protein
MVRGLRKLSTSIIYLCIVFCLVTAVFWVFYDRIERFFVFYPFASLDYQPDGRRYPYSSVYFHAQDGEKLHGWFFPGPKGAPVLLFCHGNAGNISHRLENIELLLESGLGVFIFDYRGYGNSTGKPSENGVYMDGLGAFDWLTTDGGVSPDDVVAFGRSLGAAVALETALERRMRAVVIESPFISTREMAKTMFPFMLLTPILPENFNNRRKIQAIKIPILVIHGDRDRIVPFSMGERLYRLAPEPKRFHRIPGAGHNDTYLVGGKAYFDMLAAFAESPG